MSKNSWPVFIPRPISVVRGVTNVWVYDSFVMPIIRFIEVLVEMTFSQSSGLMLLGCFVLIPIFSGLHWGLGKLLDSLYSGWSKNYPMNGKAHLLEGITAFNIAWFIRIIIIILSVFILKEFFADANNIMLGNEQDFSEDKWESISQVVTVIPYYLAVFFYHISDLFGRFNGRQAILNFANKPLFQKPEKLPFYQKNKSTIRRKKQNHQ